MEAGSYESDARSDGLVPDATATAGTPTPTPRWPRRRWPRTPLAPVAKDVDPYDERLSESIGSGCRDGDREALAGPSTTARPGLLT